MANICVIGLGKMGLPVAALFASRGNHVVGADINAQVVQMINEGRSPIDNEPGLDEMIRETVTAGRLRATTDTQAAVHASDVIVVLVPLLVDPKNQYEPTYGALESAMKGIGAGIRPGTLVILETTLPVGDTRNRLGPIIERTSGLRAGEDFLLVFSPERVQSNQVIRNLMEYPKVVGGVNQRSTEAAVQFYREALTENIIPVTDCETAEFAKIAECVYRDVNIALANEMAMGAAQVGVNINEVIAAANSEPLSNIHKPGLGVGGHCIPVYPYFMINRMANTTLASQSRLINDRMADYAVTLLQEQVGSLEGQHVLILGLSYRANVKEPTFSSAILLIESLKAAGATVIVHDPLFTGPEIERFGAIAADPELRGLPTLAAVVVQAWHNDFRTLDWRQFAGQPVVLDGRNALQRQEVEAAGLRYLAVGLGERNVPASV
jgi:nucleotide sugar dehydrogenase